MFKIFGVNLIKTRNFGLAHLYLKATNYNTGETVGTAYLLKNQHNLTQFVSPLPLRILTSLEKNLIYFLVHNYLEKINKFREYLHSHRHYKETLFSLVVQKHPFATTDPR